MADDDLLGPLDGSPLPPLAGAHDVRARGEQRRRRSRLLTAGGAAVAVFALVGGVILASHGTRAERPDSLAVPVASPTPTPTPDQGLSRCAQIVLAVRDAEPVYPAPGQTPATPQDEARIREAERLANTGYDLMTREQNMAAGYIGLYIPQLVGAAPGDYARVIAAYGERLAALCPDLAPSSTPSPTTVSKGAPGSSSSGLATASPRGSFTAGAPLDEGGGGASASPAVTTQAPPPSTGSPSTAQSPDGNSPDGQPGWTTRGQGSCRSVVHVARSSSAQVVPGVDVTVGTPSWLAGEPDVGGVSYTLTNNGQNPVSLVVGNASAGVVGVSTAVLSRDSSRSTAVTLAAGQSQVFGAEVLPADCGDTSRDPLVAIPAGTYRVVLEVEVQGSAPYFATSEPVTVVATP